MINNNLAEHTDNDGNIYYTHTVNGDIKIPAAAASFFDEFQAYDVLDVIMLSTYEKKRGFWVITRSHDEVEIIHVQDGQEKKTYGVQNQNYSYELPCFVTYEKNVLTVHRPFDDDLKALITVKEMLDILYKKCGLSISDYFKYIAQVNNSINQQ